MRIEDFKAGRFIQQYKFKSFIPNKINKEWIWSDARINSLLSEADRYLGELNAFSIYVPDVDFYIYMHVVKEATQSSKIEGTKTEIEEVLSKESEFNPEKRDDRIEVWNYIEAMNYSINKLSALPVSTRLLKQAHKKLMQGARGEHKSPGEFRSSQNWIGGTTISDAVFVPPPHTEINELMNDLEKFLHNENINVPELIKIAISHYQFETIHPFLDGNGRIGRLLITLYLVSNGILKKPTLCLSDYFEKHRTLYYENLNRVRLTNKIDPWIKFFLVSVIETSRKGIYTFQEILKLKEDIENNKLPMLGKKHANGKKLMSNLYKEPVINAKNVASFLNVSPATAISIINNFVKLDILKKIEGDMRFRVYAFQDYINLFTEKH